MRRLKDYERLRVADFSTSSYHRLHLKRVVRYLRLSRFALVYKIPPLLTYIQVQIARIIGGFENAIHVGESTIEQLYPQLRNADDRKKIIKEIENYKRNISIHKHLIKEWKWVADSIVWRLLDFKRERIRILSDSAGTGYINFLSKGFKAELSVLIELGMSWKKALLADITNCLRTGDIIIKHGDKEFEILEVKSGEKNERPRIERQQQRISEVTEALSKGELATSKGKVAFIPVKMELKTHLSDVLGLIKSTMSGEKCAVVHKFDDVLSVAVHNYYRAVSSHIKSGANIASLDRSLGVSVPDFPDKEKILRVMSYDHFNQKGGEFMRLVAPYTVYPFPADICGQLLSGQILITAWVDIGALKNAFISNGWSVEEVDPKALSKEMKELRKTRGDNQNRFKIISDDTIFKMEKGGKIVHFPFSMIGRMAYEFISTETLLDFAEQVPEAMRSKNVYGGIFEFVEERKTWV